MGLTRIVTLAGGQDEYEQVDEEEGSGGVFATNPMNAVIEVTESRGNTFQLKLNEAYATNAVNHN